MSLLQRTDVYQKAGHWHPALRPSGVMHNDVSEVTEADEDVLILNAPEAPRLVPDVMLERPAAAAEKVIKYVDSAKWCGDQRTKYAVLQVEATSFVLGVMCLALALVLVS
jgi:hypothetical protein